jgi:CRISPR-associated protein Csy1
MQDFQRYLISVKGRDSNLDIRRNIAAYVNDLIDVLLHYAAEIQALTGEAGWSLGDCKLKLAEQLWLDTWCDNVGFQQKRNDSNWQQEICSEFGFWLNKRLNDSLKNEGLVFGKLQQKHWAKLFAPRLRDFDLGTSISSASMTQPEAAL